MNFEENIPVSKWSMYQNIFHEVIKIAIRSILLAKILKIFENKTYKPHTATEIKVTNSLLPKSANMRGF